MTININGTEYLIKNSLRVSLAYENMKLSLEKANSLKPAEERTEMGPLMESFLYFYAMIFANNKDKFISFDDFIDAIDEDPNIIEKLNSVLNEEQKKNDMVVPPLSEEEKKTGAKTRKSPQRKSAQN